MGTLVALTSQTVYCSPSLSLNPLSVGWDNEIDIQKTIQLVRAQRSGMVQTEVRVGSCSAGGWPLHYHIVVNLAFFSKAVRGTCVKVSPGFIACSTATRAPCSFSPPFPLLHTSFPLLPLSPTLPLLLPTSIPLPSSFSSSPTTSTPPCPQQQYKFVYMAIKHYVESQQALMNVVCW